MHEEIELPPLTDAERQIVRECADLFFSQPGTVAECVTRVAFAAFRAGRASVPKGWMLVPVEPTPAMLDKGAMQIAMNKQRVQTAERGAEYVYRAMVAAASTQGGGAVRAAMGGDAE